MKFIVVNLAVCLVLCSSISCSKKSQHEVELDYFKSLVKELHLKEGIKYIVILPGLGCNGCIQEGEVFMKEFVNNKNILFILTNIESLKILQQKIGVDIKQHSNIHIDKENMISIPTDNKVYPCIIKLESGDIKTYEFQSPMNSKAFLKLKSRIQV